MHSCTIRTLRSHQCARLHRSMKLGKPGDARFRALAALTASAMARYAGTLNPAVHRVALLRTRAGNALSTRSNAGRSLSQPRNRDGWFGNARYHAQRRIACHKKTLSSLSEAACNAYMCTFIYAMLGDFLTGCETYRRVQTCRCRTCRKRHCLQRHKHEYSTKMHVAHRNGRRNDLIWHESIRDRVGARDRSIVSFDSR